MKCYYVTKELIARGNKVTWVKLGGKDKNHFAEGIEFTRIPIPPTNPLLTFFSLLRLVLFCVARRIQIVYLDEWLFFRHRPVSRLAGVIGLRLSGAKVVLDERDPLVDFETATGEFSAGSKWDRVAVRATRLSERLSNLVILTSKAYEQLYVSDGFPAKKVMGIFRGVDPKLFRPIAGPYSVRSKLGLDGKFVVGWFGLMHPFRQIREVLVPIAREITRTIPDGHVLIGGEGPQFSEFQSLSSEDNISVTVLGFVPYADLPKYIAACDVLLCPVDTRFRFTQHSAWLKIVEALAVGRPVIAAKTMISDLDYKDLKGVTWVDSDLPNFMKALEEIKQNYAPHLSQAQDQARHMEDFTVPRTIAKIVERVELLAGAPTG
jgi:glycosyltransferase involved in cell wall biosynthesis